MIRCSCLVALLSLPLAAGCVESTPPALPTSRPASRPAAAEDALARVAAIHGGHGPFAVAGYRMGQRALAELGLERGSGELEVVHHAPPEVQFSCVADGLQAATGASPGRLSLRVEVTATREETRSIIRDRRSGRQVVLRLAPAFLERYLNLPPTQLGDAGREVLGLDEAAVLTLER